MHKAAEVFERVGYHEASMEDIAHAVDLRKASLYYYFHSKSELLEWIHDVFVDTLLERNARHLELPMSPEQRLLEIMVDLLELARTHAGYVRIYFGNINELPEGATERILGKRNQYQGQIQAEFERGLREGSFRDIDPFLAARSLFGACIWSHFWHETDWRKDPRETAYLMWDLFINGLARRGHIDPA